MTSTDAAISRDQQAEAYLLELPSRTLTPKTHLSHLFSKSEYDSNWADDVPPKLLPPYVRAKLEDDPDDATSWSLIQLNPLCVSENIVDIAQQELNKIKKTLRSDQYDEHDRHYAKRNISHTDDDSRCNLPPKDCNRFIVTGSDGIWGDDRGDGRTEPIYARCGSQSANDYITETFYWCHEHGGVWNVF